MTSRDAPVHPNTPVLVGVGQITSHWDGTGGDAPSPQDMRRDAALRALADSGNAEALASIIDRVTVIRSFPDSVPAMPQPFGRCANPPATLAADLGLARTECHYSPAGGDQPQALVNEAAEAIFAGTIRAALIAGGETTGALKTAMKAGLTSDWSRTVSGDMRDHDFGDLLDHGFGDPMLSPYDVRNGLGMPTQTYPAIEHALRARWGLSRFDHVRLMSELWAGFSQVAVANPHSQFPAARDVDFLSTPSAANYPLADPYLKWHVAQDAVNQSGALILTSVGEAQRIGIASEKLIYLHGYAAAKDRPVTQRPDLSRSMPVERALQSALTGAGKTPDDIALFDIYSCFPCVVLIACEALGVDWRTRDMTVTGGLPFFGGPGNSYSLHAIATMTEKLRARPDAFGLILANSGFMSKEAVGVYSATPRANWQPQSSAAIQAEIDARPMPQLVTGDTVITIETYTVTWRGGVPDRAFVIGSCAEGRVLARVDKSFPGIAAKLAACDPIGRRARIAEMDGANIIADILS